MNTFAATLRSLRQERQLTQQALAVKTELAIRTIAGLEAGERIPSWETVQAIARALGVGVEVFVNQNGEGKNADN